MPDNVGEQRGFTVFWRKKYSFDKLSACRENTQQCQKSLKKSKQN